MTADRFTFTITAEDVKRAAARYSCKRLHAWDVISNAADGLNRDRLDAFIAAHADRNCGNCRFWGENGPAVGVTAAVCSRALEAAAEHLGDTMARSIIASTTADGGVDCKGWQSGGEP